MQYFFGVEIELIASPQSIQHPLLRRAYYQKLAESLQSYGLRSVADRLDGSRYRKHPEHYNVWWITKDGSLGDPEHPRIPLEAVSPIIGTYNYWESDIDTFWRAYKEVFRMPDPSRLCGCHVHVSPSPNKVFNIYQLQCIAFGVIFFEPHVESILPRYRRENKYCLKNSMRSQAIQHMGSGDRYALKRIKNHIFNNLHTAQALRDFMQGGPDSRKDRYVLWNFDNTCSGRSGSVEFRGGRGLRGPVRTKRWISFVLAFIHLCLTRHWHGYFNSGCRRPSTNKFWKKIRKAAKSIRVKQNLPSDWRVMTESYSVFSYHDMASALDDSDAKSDTDSDYSSDSGRGGAGSGDEHSMYSYSASDYDDSSSFMSKGESTYSDSDY
ncbi:putative amidoligase enzyme-domain-containing protein [Hypoxylon sp. FL1857]|nr:putative amidoligase enzyme-domain-containing protein [Hypoxylon sp. FL1857]